MIEKRIIYADDNNPKTELQGIRLSYFYMHVRAQELAGYDCCNANIDAVQDALREGFFLADLVYPNDVAPQQAIVFCKFEYGQMEGRILLVNDLLAIRECKNWVSTHGYEHDINKLKESYLDTWNLINELIRERLIESNKKLPADIIKNQMDESMEGLFLPFDLAKLAKENKFDGGCFGYYEIQDKLLVINYNNKPLTSEAELKRPIMFKIDNRNSVLPQWAIAAPTYDQIKNWFENEYDIIIESDLVNKFDINYGYGYNITEIIYEDGKSCSSTGGYGGKTYYEAINAAIEFSFKIINSLAFKHMRK